MTTALLLAAALQGGVWMNHYDADHLARISLPLGGIGTGTIGLGGRGELRDWEIMNRPAEGFCGTQIGNEAPFFAIRAGEFTSLLEGPLAASEYHHGEGRPVNHHGFPRFASASFDATYPFGRVNLDDPASPVRVELVGFNPLVPGDSEAGLLMASWPRGKPEVPFPYYKEVMTGFEYAAATEMVYAGMRDEAVRVATAIRARHDGAKRNPFSEPECGRFYARSMASWGLLNAWGGFTYSAPAREMTVTSRPGTYFWANGSAFGMVTVAAGGMPSVKVIEGRLPEGMKVVTHE